MTDYKGSDMRFTVRSTPQKDTPRKPPTSYLMQGNERLKPPLPPPTTEPSQGVDELIDIIEMVEADETATPPPLKESRSIASSDERLGVTEYQGMALVGKRGFETFDGKSYGADQRLSDDEFQVMDFALSQNFGIDSPFTPEVLRGIAGNDAYITTPNTIEEFTKNHPGLSIALDSEYDRIGRFTRYVQSLEKPSDSITLGETTMLLRLTGTNHFILPADISDRVIKVYYDKKVEEVDPSPCPISLSSQRGEAQLWKDVRTAFKTGGTCRPAEVESIRKLLAAEFTDVPTDVSIEHYLVGVYARALYREAVYDVLNAQFGDGLIEILPEDVSKEVAEKIGESAGYRLLKLYSDDQVKRDNATTLPHGSIIPFQEQIEKDVEGSKNVILDYVVEQISVITAAMRHANGIRAGRLDIEPEWSHYKDSRLEAQIAFRAENRGLKYSQVESSVITQS
ncbi:hypothetical protein GOV07_00040 [Candidatus Woesearchaeota archaeon]|nr:hypothetical protein [Candidatus Woesearchaeota archaeon]